MSEGKGKKKEEKVVPLIPYTTNPEWADITPVPQNDGPNPICPIAYSPQYVEIMNYFRAILAKDELSLRALALTEDVIAVSSANYTAWYFRRKVLDHLIAHPPQIPDPPSYEKELKFITSLGADNPKNYQLWHHRRTIVEKLNGSVDEELMFTEEMLDLDGKNYHAWAHRQWILETFKAWDHEFKYIETLLRTDLRNNSAWNQRRFVVEKTTGYGDPAIVAREIDYAFSFIKKSPNNQSPWNYLRGLFGANVPFSAFPIVKSTSLEIKDKFPVCGHVLSLLIDIYEEENNPEDLKLAQGFCRELATLDFVHKKYWLYREKTLVPK
eukprot:TRINITY_DN3113_c0_g1_i1.p1 TRINITY_DN3113_c0_g1~~TRINITY_DN3113_c0_g1_i1.p1  ORF type:complete len:325 (-),score=72.70 TRINITY_DN3113_c0_g1_i1:223-1197(-)